MKKKVLIILGIFIVLIIIIIDNQSSSEIIWTKTYNENETNPYDLKVFYEQLDSVFNQEEIVTIKNTFYEFTEENPNIQHQQNNIYINIDDGFFPDKTSEQKILDFVGTGNTVFISANQFSKGLLDSLKITKNFKGKNISNSDTLSLSFISSTETLTYKTKLKFHQNYFKDSINVKSLGKVTFKNNDSLLQKTNFIKIFYKAGVVYLHTQPEIFTNYQLLEANNTDYINQLLSYIPTKIQKKKKEKSIIGVGWEMPKVELNIEETDSNSTVYFESNFKTDADLVNSPLRFIKKQKELRWAWNLLLTGIFLFIIINAKRKQRIVPVIPKVRNTSVDFLETVAMLYEESDNFQPIIKQKIHIFYKNIRHQYNIVTDNTNPKLVSQLSLKSGYNIEKTKELIRFINNIKSRDTSSITLLTRLNQEIEDFYKNTNAWKN